MKPYAKPLSAIAMLILFTCSCALMKEIQKNAEQAKQPRIFNATDGSCQLTAPGTWSEQKDLNPKAVIQAASLRDEQYLLVLPENKMDFGNKFTIDQFANLMVETYKDKTGSEAPIEGATFFPVMTAVVNGLPARRFEIAGTVKGIKAHFIITLVEGKKNFYQIMTWTLASKYEQNKNVLIQASDSFTETGGLPPPPTPKR